MQLFKVLLLTLAFPFTTISFAFGFQIDLSTTQIQEAIEYGKTHKDDKITDLLKDWIVNIDGKQDYALVNSPFQLLTSESCKATREYKEVSSETIKGIISTTKNTLLLNIRVYGSSIDFAKNYHAVLKYKDKIVQPIYTNNPALADTSINWPEDPAYAATIAYGFAFRKQQKTKKINTIFDPNDIITLTIIPPYEHEFNFVIDLSTMR